MKISGRALILPFLLAFQATNFFAETAGTEPGPPRNGSMEGRPPCRPQNMTEVKGEMAMKTNVMVSPLAGRWFPASANDLKSEIEKMMPSPRPAHMAGVCAVLVPHAGYAYSGKVAAQVYARLDPAAYDRVVVLGPSHSVSMPNEVSIPEADALETPLGRIAVDTDFVAALRKAPMVICESRAHRSEHSDQIQVPLIQSVFGARIKVVTIVVGQMNAKGARAFADVLRPLLDSRTLVVISSDFTHFGPNFDYVPFTKDVPKQIEALDRKIFARIVACDAKGFREVMDETQATVCGRDPIAILLEMMPEKADVREIAYDTSGRMLNDWENSVSYFGAMVVGDWRAPRVKVAKEDEAPGTFKPLDEDDRLELLKLARFSLDFAVINKRVPTLEEAGVTLRPGMKQMMGGFVTLNMAGDLRGCIGEITPRREIWKVVREQALNAALNDYRFEPVTTAETKKITIEISALTPPVPVASYTNIVIGRHGMVLTKAGRSAVFLPQVAPEQGWDLATTLTHLSQKAGLPPDAWKQGAEFEVFEAQVFHEGK